VRNVVVGSISASLSTDSGIEWLACWVDLYTHVGVGAVAVVWSVDGCVAEISWRIVARSRDEAVVHVAIGTGDQDLELVSPLTIVVGVVGGNYATPEHTLDIHGRSWVCAALVVRIGDGIAFEVDVEGLAPGDCAALLRTGGGIVRV